MLSIFSDQVSQVQIATFFHSGCMILNKLSVTNNSGLLEQRQIHEYPKRLTGNAAFMRLFKGQEDVKVICMELTGNYDGEKGRSDLEIGVPATCGLPQRSVQLLLQARSMRKWTYRRE